MIFGNDSKGTIIVAGNMIGYDNFIDSNFTKPFLENEPLEVLFPPDHGSSGSNYQFNSPLGETVVGLFSMERGRRTRYFPEESRDRELPYQTEIDITYTPTLNSGIRPISDRGVSADNGTDAFLLKGSIVRGVKSGAKRFYAGPFKGFSKESQGVCIGATAVNLMDGSDCVGYLKGSFYENGYNPSAQDIFRYSDSMRTAVNWRYPFNTDFMFGTPYNGLDYSFLNIKERFKRPIPYDMKDTTDKSVSAVLISPRHAIIHADTDISGASIKFDCGTTGCEKGKFQTPTVSTVHTFKQMWDAIGFGNENQNQDTLSAFNQLKSYFDGIKVVTFASRVSGTRPISIVNVNMSEPIYYGLSIDQHSRGNHGVFCPPIGYDTFDPSSTQLMVFNEKQECDRVQGSEKEGLSIWGRTISITPSDIGSSVITYYRGTPVFLGFISAASNRQGSCEASIVGTGIGSTKNIAFPWGSNWSPIGFLNAYLSLVGVSANGITLVRTDTDTSEQYPYPSIPFEFGNRKIVLLSDIQTRVRMRSVSGGSGLAGPNMRNTIPELDVEGITPTVLPPSVVPPGGEVPLPPIPPCLAIYGQGSTADVERLTRCWMKLWYDVIKFTIPIIKRKIYCSCYCTLTGDHWPYSDSIGGSEYDVPVWKPYDPAMYDCHLSVCNWIREFYKSLGYNVNVNCPTTYDRFYQPNGCNPGQIPVPPGSDICWDISSKYEIQREWERLRNLLGFNTFAWIFLNVSDQRLACNAFRTFFYDEDWRRQWIDPIKNDPCPCGPWNYPGRNTNEDGTPIHIDPIFEFPPVGPAPILVDGNGNPIGTLTEDQECIRCIAQMCETTLQEPLPERTPWYDLGDLLIGCISQLPLGSPSSDDLRKTQAQCVLEKCLARFGNGYHEFDRGISCPLPCKVSCEELANTVRTGVFPPGCPPCPT